MGNKILAIADIHINDYTNRNPSNKYRLLQSRKVAQNIIKVGEREGCDTIVLAGDIVEKSVVRPYVQAEVKLFLDTIMEHFKEGFIIWGNHDLDGKSVDQEISDACLGVMLPKNLHYAHKQVIQIGNTTIGFCNWMPKFDLSWINGKVNILFTHAEICYSTNPAEKHFDSQDLDENKFDLAISGHIHKRGQIGKYVSIGCTQRCKMCDPEEASGVVVDCDNNSWKWVDLNPDNNLMKFAYTDIMEDEGWDNNTGTWYIYKQPNSILDQSGKIKVDAWKEINDLTEEAIKKAGLDIVHNEVLKYISNIDSGEVDFNFTLQHLHCENWRSIKSVDIDFNDLDKILIVGSNGSGKSSLLSAIKFALCDVSDTVGISSLKPFITFGEKECLTEITFLYQGLVCKIQRGTKKYGLWIDGVQMKYNEKRAFEKDVRERFPFIKYMDAFFFDADKTSFLKSLSPERITEITSKFLKLNRIDTYCDTARHLYDQYKKQSGEWFIKSKESEKILIYLNDKKKTLVKPIRTKDELIQAKNEGILMQKQYEEWNNFKTELTILQTKRTTLIEKINELGGKQFKDPNILNLEIQNAKNELVELQKTIDKFGNLDTEISYKINEFNRLGNEGSILWNEKNSIKVGAKCSKCGQTIKTTEAMETHKLELENKISEIGQKYKALGEEIESLKNTKDNLKEEYDNAFFKRNQLNNIISNNMAELRLIETTKSEIERYKLEGISIDNKINNLVSVPEIQLPENFMSQISQIESDLNMWKEIEDVENEVLKTSAEYSTIQQKVTEYDNALRQLNDYITLTGPTGIIFEEIFNRLANQFTSNSVVYKVIRKGKGNREHLSLAPHYNNSGNLVSIELCSSGQRTLLDIDYLSKIIDRIGLLVLDEFFKNLDNDRLEEMLEILKGMNIGCLMLTSHADSIPAFYNKTCIASLNSSSMTDLIFR